VFLGIVVPQDSLFTRDDVSLFVRVLLQLLLGLLEEVRALKML